MVTNTKEFILDELESSVEGYVMAVRDLDQTLFEVKQGSIRLATHLARKGVEVAELSALVQHNFKIVRTMSTATSDEIQKATKLMDRMVEDETDR